MEPGKTNLLGLDRAALDDFFLSLGERSYRSQQLMKWIYQRGVLDFSAMTDLSKSLRNQLHEQAELELPERVQRQVSRDGTVKSVFRVCGDNYIETVLIPEPGRNTLCVSSQVGCMLDCSFCSTGKQGFDGNLSAADIIGQLWVVNQELQQEGKATGPGFRVSNVVLMGMGEPLLNFAAVLSATNVMTDDSAFGLSKRRVTISTAGVVPGIQQLAGLTDVSLAISLHAPNDELRNELVPINRKYPISKLLEACHSYLSSLSDKRSITVEYTLLDGVNDSTQQARELAYLLRELRCKINLIPFNPFPGSGYAKPSKPTVLAFQNVLAQSGHTAHVRTTRGDDIDAACGQLVGRVQDRTRRQEKYRARLQTNGHMLRPITTEEVA